MGVTLHGISPRKEEGELKQLDNYANLTKEEKQELKREIFIKKEHKELTFSDNWWHWRPIAALIEGFNTRFKIGIPQREINALSYNDGIGISNPEHCLSLAKSFKDLILSMKNDGIDTVHLVTNYWYYKGVGPDGKIVENRVYDLETLIKLRRASENKEYILGDIELEGVNYLTFHRTNIDNLERFVAFLEACNGFIVY